METRKEIVYHVATVLLVVLFSFASAIKLVPHLIDDWRSREIVIEFTRYVAVPPVSFLKLSAETYRVLVGLAELTMVVLMVVGYQKRRLQVLTAYGLLLLITGALYTHLMIRDPVEKMAAAMLCFALIVIRLYVLGLFKVHVKFD